MLEILHTLRSSRIEQRPAAGQEVPALRWAGVGGASYGFAILNDARYGSPRTGLVRNANTVWLNGRHFREDLAAARLWTP